MRVILDTNVIISGMLSPSGNADFLLRRWMDGNFVLLSSSEQLEEIKSTLRKPYIASHIKPHDAGKLVNLLRRLTLQIESHSAVHRSPDPEDDFLLSLAEAGDADFLVTGDKAGLLALKRHKGTRIVSVSQFLKVLR